MLIYWKIKTFQRYCFPFSFSSFSCPLHSPPSFSLNISDTILPAGKFMARQQHSPARQNNSGSAPTQVQPHNFQIQTSCSTGKAAQNPVGCNIPTSRGKKGEVMKGCYHLQVVWRSGWPEICAQICSAAPGHDIIHIWGHFKWEKKGITPPQA